MADGDFHRVQICKKSAERSESGAVFVKLRSGNKL